VLKAQVFLTQVLLAQGAISIRCY